MEQPPVRAEVVEAHDIDAYVDELMLMLKEEARKQGLAPGDNNLFVRCEVKVLEKFFRDHEQDNEEAKWFKSHELDLASLFGEKARAWFDTEYRGETIH